MSRPTDNLVRTSTQPMELRADGDGDGNTLFGHFTVFNEWTEINSYWEGRFLERNAPGMLDETIKGRSGQIKVLVDHGADPSIGNKPLGPIRELTGDAYYEVDLLDDADSQRVRMLVERGDVARSSFAAYMHESDWSQTPDGFPLRTVVGMSLVDVAPVDDPAYFDTSTGLRSLAEQRGMDVSEVEALARENRLTELVKAPPVVVDLGSRNSDSDAQVDNHAPGRLLAMRRALEIEEAD